MHQTYLPVVCLFLVMVASARAQQPAAVKKAAEPEYRIPDGVAFEADVEYGRAGDRSLTLDLFRPKQQGDRTLPVVVYIHGGGWERGNKREGHRVLSELVLEGNYAAVTVAYRLSGEAIWPAQIHDCKAAVRWVRSNAKKYGFDPDRIGVCGGSAGGHLAAIARRYRRREGAGGRHAATPVTPAACSASPPPLARTTSFTSTSKPSANPTASVPRWSSGNCSAARRTNSRMRPAPPPP